MIIINYLKGLIKKSLSLFPIFLNPIARASGDIKISRYIKTFTDFGMRLELDPYEYLDKNYLFNLYDKKSINFLKVQTLDCELFFDIGANLGFYGFALASSNINLISVLVEPDHYSIEKIKRNVELNQFLNNRVKYLNCAASIDNKNIELMLNTVGNRGGSSVCIDQREWTRKKENITTTAKGLTLFEIVKKFAPYKSFKWCCKLDIEGYEYPVLKKFLSDSTKEFLPEAFVIEWTGRSIAGESDHTSIDLLLDNGYKLVGKEGPNYLLKKS